jgi:hypothetical protein
LVDFSGCFRIAGTHGFTTAPDTGDSVFKRRGRPTLRETLTLNKAACDFYAAAGDKPPRESVMLNALPPKRHRVKRPVDGKPAAPYERDVLVQIIKALRADPRVARVERNQSGVFQDGNRYIRVGVRGKARPNCLPEDRSLRRDRGQARRQDQAGSASDRAHLHYQGRGRNCRLGVVR